MTTDLTVYDAEMLKVLGGMVNKDDAGGAVAGPPTLKINYDPDSKLERGAWVVGQRKDNNGAITDEGEVVKGLVILTVRNRWSYYNQKDTSQNCNSPFYLRGEAVRGSKYGHVCGKGCPMRAEGLQVRCKCQTVLFGKAVTAAGKLIDCVSYQSGASYMPAQEYLKSIERAKVKGGYIDIPLFASLTLLGSRKEKNEGTTYFVSVFTQGPMFKDRNQLMAFQAGREEVYAYIQRVNNAIAEAKEQKADGKAAPTQTAPPNVAPATTPPASVVPNDDVVTVTPIQDASVPDFAKAITGQIAPPASEPPPWETSQPVNVTPPSAAAPESDFDLIGAINGLLGK